MYYIIAAWIVDDSSYNNNACRQHTQQFGPFLTKGAAQTNIRNISDIISEANIGVNVYSVKTKIIDAGKPKEPVVPTIKKPYIYDIQ